MNALRWPVYDDPFFCKKPLHVFDDYDEAVRCVHAALGTVNLYIGEPRRAEIIQLEARPLGDGRYGVAA